MSDAIYEAAYAEIEQAARDGILSEYLEEKICIIFDRIAARTINATTQQYAAVGKAFIEAIDTAMQDWAEAEADGKHTRDGPKIDPNKWAFDNKLEST